MGLQMVVEQPSSSASSTAMVACGALGPRIRRRPRDRRDEWRRTRGSRAPRSEQAPFSQGGMQLRMVTMLASFLLGWSSKAEPATIPAQGCDVRA
eukprot:1548193-Alexandrium_andersonii.AAC.1